MDERGEAAGPASADEMLAQAHRRIRELEAIVDSLPDGIYVGDADGVRHANRAALEMLGYDTVEALNRHVGPLMAELDARDAEGSLLAVEENVFVRALAGESGCMDVHVQHRQSNQRRIMRCSAAPLHDRDRAVIGAMAVNVDVTERRRLERELRTQRALVSLELDVLALLVERASLEVQLHALAVGLEALAPGMLASVLAIEDGHMRHLAAPSLPVAWCAAIDNTPIGPQAGSCGTAAFRGERVIVTDIAVDPLWDHYRAVALPHGLRACWSQPITSTQGIVIGTVALYYRDPRAPTEDDIAVIEGTARVARLVLERHRNDAARERLVNELRETLEHNEVLTGILGHDLRSPLSAITTGIWLALSHEADPKRRRVLERVEASGLRMSRMIDQLLDLTRVRVGNGLPVKRTEIDLANVARGVASEVQTANPDRRLEIDISGDTNGQWDADRLSQVFSNLLCNAMQYGGTSEVVLRVDGRDEHCARFEVHNDGAIPDDQLPWLFDPFRRGPIRSQGSQGLGLGLYIAKQIVLAHGGEIAVHSTPGSGTTFQVSLPRSS